MSITTNTIKINYLTKDQSDQILDFAYKCGVDNFDLDILNINQTSDVVKIENQLMEFLKKFSIKEKFLYNKTTINLLKNYVIEGILPNYFKKQFNFEDFVFFKDDAEFFATTTHEQIGILYLTEAELDEFKKMNIDFELVTDLR